MVGSHYIGEDFGGLDPLLERLGNEPIVDAPTHVALAGKGEMAPPSVVAVAFAWLPH